MKFFYGKISDPMVRISPIQPKGLRFNLFLHLFIFFMNEMDEKIKIKIKMWATTWGKRKKIKKKNHEKKMIKND